MIENYGDDVLHHPLVATSRLMSLACPELVEGQLTDGRCFYFRYRRGYAIIGLGETLDDAAGDCCEVGASHGDELQGVFENMGERDLIFKKLLQERLSRACGHSA